MTPGKDIREKDKLLEDFPVHAPIAMEKFKIYEDINQFKTEEERQKYSDFIRKYVLATVVDKFKYEMACRKCHKKFLKKPEFKMNITLGSSLI